MISLPISVLITTKNEERNIERCLRALSEFDEVVVIDSKSDDRTAEIAKEMGARVEPYRWDGQYPKKRQWCLQQLDLRHYWVFWVDADEVVTPALVAQIRSIFTHPPHQAGFFIKGQYVWNGKPLRYGLSNNKLALFHRDKIEFPVVNDLDIEGMGEIEGHYQPVLKADCKRQSLGQIAAPLLHYAYDDVGQWDERHRKYAQWEAAMNKRGAWPKDPIWWRERLKTQLRRSMFRPSIMFIWCYIVKGGFMDGQRGLGFARSRYKYCTMIRSCEMSTELRL